MLAFQILGSDLCKKVCELVAERRKCCIDAEEHQFERLNIDVRTFLSHLSLPVMNLKNMLESLSVSI